MTKKHSKPSRSWRTVHVKKKYRDSNQQAQATDSEPGSRTSNQTDRIDPADYSGVIISSHGYMAQVLVAEKEQRMCHIQLGAKAGVVVGDRVFLEKLDDEYPVVTRLMPRRNKLQRPTSSGRLKLVAANLDRLVIVSAVSPPLREGLIDRYLVTAEHLGVRPIIVLNKVDLEPDGRQQALLDQFRELDYQVLITSAITGEGIDSLRESLKGLASALVGHSGVGKSTIINRLLPEARLPTGELSDSTGRGQHVTSVSTLHRLPGGGFVVDSPGIRSLGLAGIEAKEVAGTFIEFAPYQAKCLFDDCLHQVEKGCAVIKAVDEGKISPRRHQSYLRIMQSIQSGEWD